MSVEKRSQLLPLVRRQAMATGCSWELLDAIIQTESGYNQFATRSEVDRKDGTPVQFVSRIKKFQEAEKFAKANGTTQSTEIVHQLTSWGLCQLLGVTARSLSYGGALPALCDPELNLYWMGTLITSLMRRYTDEDYIIAAYNAGSARLQENGKFINQEYVDKVREAMRRK